MEKLTEKEFEYLESDEKAVEEAMTPSIEVEDIPEEHNPEHMAFIKKFNKDLMIIMIRHIFIFTMIFWITSVYLTSRDNDLRHNKEIEDLRTQIEGVASQNAALAAEVDHYANDIRDLQARLKDTEDLVEIHGREIEFLSNEIEKINILIEDGYFPETLNKTRGVAFYNGHKETWYNLDMTYVVEIARQRIAGYADAEYWVREDGCKMLGNYIMVAADQTVHPYGSIVETSLGEGIVVDTGSFIYISPYQIDIAVDWRG